MKVNLVKGQKIYRDVVVTVLGDEVSMEMEFAKTPVTGEFEVNSKNSEDGFVFRATESEKGFLVANPQGEAGLVCFCSDEIPDDYTHFIITDILAGGSCVHVKPISGSLDALLEKFEIPTDTKYSVDEILEHMTPEQIAKIMERRAIHTGDYDSLMDHLTVELTDCIATANAIALKTPQESRIAWQKIVVKIQNAHSDVVGF